MAGRSQSRSTSQPSLHDVARLAGVGIATASRTISGKGSVSPETRARVMDAVAKLGYRPNPLARSMRSDRSGIVAFMVPDLINEYYAVSAEVIHRELTAAGYQLIITSAASAEEERRTFQWLGDYRMDGVIHVPVDPSLHLPDDRPIVQINRVSSQQSVSAVLADEIDGFDRLTRKLLEYGHRDIAMVTGEDEHSSTRRRMAGMRMAVDDRKDVRVRVRPGHFSEEWGYQATKSLLDDLPHVVIASGPRIASGVVHALQENGLDIPGDLSVVSFDDPGWFSLWRPGMTSVVPPLEAMAQRAVAKLVEMIDQSPTSTPAIEYFACDIRERGSLGRRSH